MWSVKFNHVFQLYFIIRFPDARDPRCLAPPAPIPPDKGHDPLIDELSTIQLSQFLNVVTEGHPIFWAGDKITCMWCNKEGVNGRHVIERCKKGGCKYDIRKALDTNCKIRERVEHVKKIIRTLGEIEQGMVAQNLNIEGKRIFNVQFPLTSNPPSRVVKAGLKADAERYGT